MGPQRMGSGPGTGRRKAGVCRQVVARLTAAQQKAIPALASSDVVVLAASYVAVDA